MFNNEKHFIFTKKNILNIRPIQPKDNVKLARVIRGVLAEHGVDKPGTVFTDPTTDNLFELFEEENAYYWVVDQDDELLGGAGLYPTKGLPEGCIELVKIYLHKDTRGKGVGKKLMELCIEKAIEKGFNSIYLETMPELSNAIGLYEQKGFVMLEEALGDSGHFACELRMLKKLKK